MTAVPVFLLGLGLGLAAGVSPGPLMTLVVTASLQRGLAAGARVAVAPLLTDLPVIVLCVAFLAAVPAGFLRWLTTGGAVFVAYLGLRTLRDARSAGLLTGPAKGGPRRDLLEGVVVNLLSPHPWLFWIAVGGPVLVNAWQTSPAGGLLFVAGFYAVLVGSKLALAWLVAHGRERLARHWQRRLLAACGLLLLGLSLVLLHQAWGTPAEGASAAGPVTAQRAT